MTQVTDNGPKTATRQARGFVAGETEARPGIMTTEFWLTLLAAAVLVVAAYIDDGIADRWGWILATAVIVAYVLSRGIAKSGSKEGPFLARFGDGDGGRTTA
jgi:hypothetical protein